MADEKNPQKPPNPDSQNDQAQALEHSSQSSALHGQASTLPQYQAQTLSFDHLLLPRDMPQPEGSQPQPGGSQPMPGSSQLQPQGQGSGFPGGFEGDQSPFAEPQGKRSGEDWLLVQNELLRQQIDEMRTALQFCTEALKQQQQGPPTAHPMITSTGPPRSVIPPNPSYSSPSEPQMPSTQNRQTPGQQPSDQSDPAQQQQTTVSLPTHGLFSQPRPKEPLPKFSGDKRTWARFAIAFEMSTHMYKYTQYENNVR